MRSKNSKIVSTWGCWKGKIKRWKRCMRKVWRIRRNSLGRIKIRSRCWKITTISYWISSINSNIINNLKYYTNKNYNSNKINTYNNNSTLNPSPTKTPTKTTVSPTPVTISEPSTTPNKTSSTDNSTPQLITSVFLTLKSLDTILRLLITSCLHKKKYWCKCNMNNVMSTNSLVIYLLRYNNLNYSHSKTLLKNASKCKNKF